MDSPTALVVIIEEDPKESPNLNEQEPPSLTPVTSEETAEEDTTQVIVIFEEDDNSQDHKTNVIQEKAVNTNIEEENKKDSETPINDKVETEINAHSNIKIDMFDKTEIPNDEISRKRSQENSNEAATEPQDTNINKKKKIELFTDLDGPEWYNVKGNLVTRSIITKNLPKLYESLPIYGRPEKNDIEKFTRDKLREFIGPDIVDDEFDELAKYCSPARLKTGQELVVKSSFPSQGMLSAAEVSETSETNANLCILKKCKMRMNTSLAHNYSIKLKYRGVRLIPWNQDDDKDSPEDSDDVMLEPGKDILYRIRIYRPYTYNIVKERCTRGRHSVFNCDMALVGRLRLSALRERLVCHNDVDMRVDVSDTPGAAPPATAKTVFPSGFLFINNTFYVDSRPGCKDHSRVIREWAARRGMGRFPIRDMHSTTLDEVVVRLGYPEVYVHQGNCEHVFTFSEIRLLSGSDPLRLRWYPRHSSVSQHQTVYCTTCAEFGAKWVVVGCARVPFDPAFFCDACFNQYLYIDGVKVGEFKAYSYRGNETNTLKPCF